MKLNENGADSGWNWFFFSIFFFFTSQTLRHANLFAGRVLYFLHPFIHTTVNGWWLFPCKAPRITDHVMRAKFYEFASYFPQVVSNRDVMFSNRRYCEQEKRGRWGGDVYITRNQCEGIDFWPLLIFFSNNRSTLNQSKLLCTINWMLLSHSLVEGTLNWEKNPLLIGIPRLLREKASPSCRY